MSTILEKLPTLGDALAYGFAWLLLAATIGIVLAPRMKRVATRHAHDPYELPHPADLHLPSDGASHRINHTGE